MEIPPEAEQYRGKRWQILRNYESEDLALLHLHKWFDGNATAAAGFLGFKSKKVVRQRWAKLGLGAFGKDAPRRHIKAGWPETRTLDELWDGYIKLNDQEERVINYEWDLPEKAAMGKLIPISDIHAGHIGCDFKRFAALCTWIKRHPQTRWFLGGDQVDACTQNSPGTHAEQYCTINEAVDLVARALKPIQSQGIVIFDGNHEVRIGNDTDTDISPSQILSDQLDLPWMGLHGHIVHRLGEQVYKHYHHHGRGSARTEGGKLNTGLSFLRNVTDEIVTIGHLHVEISLKDLTRHVNEDLGVVGYQTRRLVMCPSFLGYRGYSEDSGYKPSSLGVSAIELSVKEHDIKVIE